MAQMNNYFYVGTQQKSSFIIPENFDENFSLSGNCIREGFKDNSYVVTSHIEEITEGSVRTHSGSIYELKDMDSDYREFLEAVASNIPILEEWNIEGSLRHGYILSGMVNGKKISEKIISQEKNFVILKDFGKCFVQWRNFSYETECEISLCGKISDLVYTNDFEKCAGFMCRPVLFK